MKKDDIERSSTDEKNVGDNKKEKNKSKWPFVVIIVIVCLILICGAVLWYFLRNNDSDSSSDTSADSSSDVPLEVESKDINIYYVQDNEILCESENLRSTPQDIFDAWRSRNGIGDEVSLIDVKTEDNGHEEIESSGDSQVANYSQGDKFTLNLTVSENLKEYYEKIPEDKLLESLKKTMTEEPDSGIEYDEYILNFG